METAPSKTKLPAVFFDGRRGEYWIELESRFLKVSPKDVFRHFIHCDSSFGWEDWVDGMKQGDRVFVKAQIERHVDYAGPLAGHKCGAFLTSSGNRILVTTQPRLDFGKAKGEFEFIDGFIGRLLGGEQAEYFLAWLKFARASLLAGDFRPGQCLVLAGAGGCGKSFLQVLITEILGGRVACPFRYMMGESSFNLDLAMAEHLAIEDKNASTDIRSRRSFGARIKEFTVCAEMSIHGKGCTAITLPTYKRLTISVNDESENLLIVPPLDASLADKITLFKCDSARDWLHEDRAKNMSLIRAELPAFVAFLAKHTVRKEIRCTRYGVKSYHHPDLLQELTHSEPHTRLLALIDEFLFDDKSPTPLTGTAAKLETRLREAVPKDQIDKLLYFSGACGTYLGRLAHKLPDRVKCNGKVGINYWTIKAP